MTFFYTDVKKIKGYHYEERMDELSRINKIPYVSIRIDALKRFLEDENKILAHLGAPYSQAQKSAMQKLAQSSQPQTPYVQNPGWSLGC